MPISGAQVPFNAGTGSGTYRPSGVILKNITPAATAGTSEETLATVTIPGNTLAVDGQSLRITAVFTTAANTNSKSARLRWNATGGSNIATQTVTSSAAAITLVGTVTRTGAATQNCSGYGIGNATAMTAIVNPDTVALSGDIVVYVRGTTATSAGDLTFQSLTVEYLP